MIRMATADDIPRLIEIRTAVRENRLSNPLSIGRAAYAAFMNHSPIWVWEDSRGIAGFSAGDTTTGWIWALFVDPPCEGRGIGQELLGLVERMPRLKAFFIRQAAGLSGPAPRLLKGEAI